jgi:LPXTG-site transpeptidase (sortase) family protein
VNQPRPAVVVFWTSIGVIVATLLVLGTFQWRATEQVAVEAVGSRPAATASPSPTPDATTQSPSPSPTPTPGPVMVAAPVRVSIPALDVNTKIFPVGLDKNRAIEIPEDIRFVGWYDLGVPPGVDRGSAVLVAHRDGRVQGRGVFYFLGNLDVGDKVVVKTSAGEELPYKVVSRESILKKRLPYEELFAVDGPPRLTLISCGGYYDPDNGGYQDNVVVTAVPMFEPIPTEPIPSATPSGTTGGDTGSQA